MNVHARACTALVVAGLASQALALNLTGRPPYGALASAWSEPSKQDRDLALVHIPFNFGHTIEAVALISPELDRRSLFATVSMGHVVSDNPTWDDIKKLSKPRAEVWGHAHPDLAVTSEVTGCPMYFTPQKYWPEDLAQKYFGNKTVFGNLRDPYERLIAMFRDNNPGYGGGFNEVDRANCDINSALRTLMTELLAHRKEYGSTDFRQKCTFVPQAAYFEGKYGISLPINNRRFPDSMNEAFADHGYPDFHIEEDDIFHVHGCDHVWSADLESDVKKMIRDYFAADFELLCRHFGYCDDEESTCIAGVKTMCPKHVLQRGLMSTKPTPRRPA